MVNNEESNENFARLVQLLKSNATKLNSWQTSIYTLAPDWIIK
jgi:hypothetical protein